MKKLTCILILLSMLGTACVTIKQPDGTSETRIDIDTTIALTQLALTTAEQALSLWLMYQEQQGVQDEAGTVLETAARQQRIETLKGVLAELYAKRGATS